MKATRVLCAMAPGRRPKIGFRDDEANAYQDYRSASYQQILKIDTKNQFLDERKTEAWTRNLSI